MAAGLDLLSLDLDDIDLRLQTLGESDRRLVVQARRRLASILVGIERLDQVAGLLERRPPGARSEVIDVAALARRLASLGCLGAAEVRWTVEIGCEPYVRGSPSDIGGALLNLVKNAIESFEEGGGSVAIRVKTQESDCVIEVEDDGPGMGSAACDRAFDPRFTTKPQGTGLGLPFVRDIAIAHGGSVALDSAPGRGTRVTVRLPLCSPPGGEP